ncbi:MAG: helix-turn-helix transcriptional regulator [Treponema sp.]|nr:helix-turn-helix transcriptional regulator [Treponema sp.]
MGFWDNVIIELDYLGMTNKSLAEKCGFDASNIGRGIKLGSAPSVETAVKIAKELNVSVEYLVTGNEPNRKEKQNNIEIHLFHKYSSTLKDLDSLPDQVRKPIISLIENLKDEFSQ